MEFLSLEAEEDSVRLRFSDEDESEKTTDELDDFINDAPIEEGGVSFYRERNPLDVNDYPKVNGQVRILIEAIFSDDESCFGDDEQPELFAPKNRDEVTFDKFEGFKKSVENFRKTLNNFSNVENYLFNSVIYGLLFYKQGKYQQLAGAKPKKDNAQKLLGDDLYFDLIDIEFETLLDKTLFGFFDRCYNEVLAKYGFFLKFFERRNVYRFLIKKKVQVKNEVTRNLSDCIIEKFNGYEIIRNDLSRKEKLNFKPIDIVYEPSFDENSPVVCNFASTIHTAYKSYIGRFVKCKERLVNRSIRQCHYCQNYFAKNEEAMHKRLSVCAAKEGITYSFDNGQIIDYQVNFKYMGGVPFCVYFHFETTTGDSVFSDSKMYIIRYCLIFSFHPALNLDKIFIYRSF